MILTCLNNNNDHSNNKDNSNNKKKNKNKDINSSSKNLPIHIPVFYPLN